MKVKKIEISKIVQPENSRLEITKIHELMQSIKENKLIQPIVVAPHPRYKKSKFVVVAGNRRFLACKKLGWKTIPASVSDSVLSESQFETINLVENLQRENISAFEEGRYIDSIMRREHLTANEIAIRLGKSRNRIEMSLLIYKKVPTKYRRSITYTPANKTPEKGKISATVAFRIEQMYATDAITKKQYQELYEKAFAEQMSTSKIRNISADIKRGVPFKKALESKQRNLTSLTVGLSISLEERARLTAKYEDTFRNIIVDILRGNIKEKVNCN